MKPKISKIIIVIIFIFLAFFGGRFSVNKEKIEEIGYKKGYDTAWDKAKETVDSLEMPIFPTPKELNSIRGEIKDIFLSEETLSIKAAPVSTNPFSPDSKPTTRQIIINENTKIIKWKTPEEVQIANKETRRFSEEEITEKMTFNQLKAGDYITVTSDKDIKKEMNITAVKIEINTAVK